MKKIIVLILAITILVLSACTDRVFLINGTVSEDQNSVTTAPIISSNIFTYNKSVNPSIDLFIDWLCSGGTVIVRGENHSKYEENRAILDWAATQNRILVSFPTDEDFVFRSMRVRPYTNTYQISFKNEKKDMTAISTILTPLTSEQKDKDIIVLASERWGDGKGYKKAYSEKFGEYVYNKSEKKVYCVYQDHLIYLRIVIGGEEWSPEHLNYIDFKFVTLKKEQTESQSN